MYPTLLVDFINKLTPNKEADEGNFKSQKNILERENTTNDALDDLYASPWHNRSPFISASSPIYRRHTARNSRYQHFTQNPLIFIFA
jgi:hypothetical protein